MTVVRRSLVLTLLVLATLVAGVLPAWASFTTKAAGGTAPVSTGTVAPPTGVTEKDSCTTVTKTTTEVLTYDSTTKKWKVTSKDVDFTYADSDTDVESKTTSEKPGPGPNQKTRTTIEKDTDLTATVSWVGSGSRGVSGYLVTARLSNGTTVGIAETPADARSITLRTDASVLQYEPRAQVTTLTTYGWTASSTLTAVLTC
ncbi:hypothetical protein [Geodermatophilus sp. DSM 44513]|uniref:hypothetical protein n=1 Tax=Geodermatophilus sp. DSM 44513 TaxID=1528104 RepID=UPI001277BABA|nr:hypothetical protein [Geodermatophilus sp. DSM 44513]WNV76722.1 hypothetical protein RTG05_05465 [Geodermatophilus sp. DSM 44513]